MDKTQTSPDRHGYDLIKPGAKWYQVKKLLTVNEAIKEATKLLCQNLKKQKLK